jgi:hypothetical protein
MSSKSETEHLSQVVSNVTKVIELHTRQRMDRKQDEQDILRAFDTLTQLIRYGPKPGTDVEAELSTEILAKTEKIIALAKEETKALMRQYRMILNWLLWKVPERSDLQIKIAVKYFDWWLIGYAEVCNIDEMVMMMFKITELGMNSIITETVERLTRNPAVTALFNAKRAELRKVGKFADGRQQQLPSYTKKQEPADVGHD